MRLFRVRRTVRTGLALAAAGLLAVVSVPGAERGAVGVLVPAGVAGGGRHPLPQAAADAAVLLHGVLVAVLLGETGAVVVSVGTGVARVRSHAVTQTTALNRGV